MRKGRGELGWTVNVRRRLVRDRKAEIGVN